MREEKLKQYYDQKHSAEAGGGPDKVESQHSKGKLTARERINLLLDPNTFTEIDKFVTHRSDDPEMKKYYGDGLITGFGTIDGKQVFIYVYDFTVLGGSLGEMAGKKVSKVMAHALKVGCPIIGILDSGGARIQEGVSSLDGYGDIFSEECSCIWCNTSNNCEYWTMCWWSCILSSDDRFRHNG